MFQLTTARSFVCVDIYLLYFYYLFFPQSLKKKKSFLHFVKFNECEPSLMSALFPVLVKAALH